MNRKRVFLAGLFHESHSFLSNRTREADFTTFHGENLVRENQDNGSPISAILEHSRLEGWKVVPSVYSHAMPGPVVEQTFIDKTFSIILADLEAGIHDLDGICLVLHGAMLGEEMDDVEGELLEKIQRLMGTHGVRIPVCGVLDLHCNFTRKMAVNSSALIAYRKNPHTDAAEAATAAARLLGRLMAENLAVQTAYRHPPIVLPPVQTSTDSDPMRALLDKAADIETARGDILAVNVFAGFAYSDTADSGLSFSIVTSGSVEKVEDALGELCAVAGMHKSPLEGDERNLDELLPTLRPSEDGPVLLIEASDNIGGGTPGDGAFLLQKLLEHRVDNFAVVIADPSAVTLCQAAGIGAVVDLELGGKVDRFHGDPVRIKGRIEHLSDGRFTLENKKSHLASMVGIHANMGPCATLSLGTGRILITSLKTPPMDLAQLRSQGIVPEKMSFIGIKAALAHKSAYDPIAAASYYVDTPGLGTNDLRSLPYKKIRRPIHPLDDVADCRSSGGTVSLSPTSTGMGLQRTNTDIAADR